MVDQLRLFWNRPLRDGDRPCLFAVAAAVIVAAVGVFTLLDRTTPSPPALVPTRSGAPVQSSTLALALPSPSPERSAPSEESQPTAALGASPADVAASKRAARAFLAGYLPYTYGRGRGSHIPAASPALRRELRAQPPQVPARERRRHPQLVVLQSDGVGPDHAQLAALVDDGRRRYTVSREMTRTATGWIVTGLGD